MVHDIMSQFYTSFNLPLPDKLIGLTRIIDQSTPNKDLQALFPQLISNIFCDTPNGWGLRMVLTETHKCDFEMLMTFFEPLGPMFRLCYKLLTDPQLKYSLPINTLPIDLQMTLERGRCPQFYADMLITDPQSLNIVALALNPFDYFIFNFALYLVNSTQNKSSWENWNSVYFALACDYLMHFLPSDPNASILPHIPNYTGKVPMAAPLQTANRPLYSPSLLLIPDLTGNSMSNQHTVQNQSRNEVWRSETVLQVFIDIWMCVEQFGNGNVEMFQRNHSMITSPERVRTVRVLVKHLHSFSAKHQLDPAVRSSALRKYARQLMCARAYHYVRHLVTTWPLDASFRLVMELWLSLIQPWRYVNNTISQDRFPASNNNQEESTRVLDISFTQFIAENFPSYTCIFQLVLPRFMRLDLTAYKNAVMLFRLGKVFSQEHLVPILRNLEQAITDSGSGASYSPDTSHNNSGLEQSYTYNGVQLHKWVAIARQAISEFHMSANFEYEPVWSENTRLCATGLIKRILSAKQTAEANLQEFSNRQSLSNRGMWGSIKNFLMINDDKDEEMLSELKKVPNYLNASIHQFSNIFALNEGTIIPPESTIEENSMERSSFVNSSSFPFAITNKLRSNPTSVHYMGDPDLMPITSYENTILVRMMYQIASRLNEMYGDQFSRAWNSNDFWGHVAREVLQGPCTIQTYMKDAAYHQNVVAQQLTARLSLRRLGSHSFIFWISIGYVLFRLLSYSGLFYAVTLILMWMSFVCIKATLKMLRVI